MQDLKNTNIGGKDITLRRVPAREARHIQTMIVSLVAEPFMGLVEAQSGGNAGKKVTQGELNMMGLKAITSLIPILSDGELDALIDKCKPFIMVDGKPFDENSQFDADTLFDMYQVLIYFLRETFSAFLAAALSRFPQAETAMTALSKQGWKTLIRI